MKQKTSANKQSPRRASLEQQNPGDEAPRGTPGTGEDICPDCKGRGRLGGLPCPNCRGTGKIIRAIGGA
jgi:DnaJ-class molecular chaperone